VSDVAVADPPGLLDVCRFESAKLLAQWPARILPLVCILGPLAFGAVLRVQSAVPQDTLFGGWVHTSGFAIPLVILSFAGAWVFPVIAGIVGGDMFAGEDRLGTWKTLLTRSSRRSDVFVGKVVIAGVYVVLMIVLLGATSILAGVLATGTQPLVGLSGQILGSGHALELTVASWAVSLLPALAFTGLALLVSAVTRSSAAGVLAPLVAALMLQLLSLIGSGEIVHALLVSSAIDAWHGMFAVPGFSRPLVWGALVSVAYAAVFVGIAWLSLRDRDIAGAAPGERRWRRPLRVLVVAIALVVLLAVASNWGPTAITQTRLERSIVTNFRNLTVLQQQDLGRHDVGGNRMRILPSCRRQGVATRTKGPGDNWVCILNVFTATGSQATIDYDLTVQTNGCYTAEGPPAFIGPLTIRGPGGRRHVNPLFRFDGCFDVAP
jgi:ABC-2 type transport system permease protein